MNRFSLKADMRQCQARSELFCKVAGAISHFPTGKRSQRSFVDVLRPSDPIGVWLSSKLPGSQTNRNESDYFSFADHRRRTGTIRIDHCSLRVGNLVHVEIPPDDELFRVPRSDLSLQHIGGGMEFTRSRRCSALPCFGRRAGADPIPLGACLSSNDGALPWVQTADSISGQWHIGIEPNP
jgi:hypothetical protein